MSTRLLPLWLQSWRPQPNVPISHSRFNEQNHRARRTEEIKQHRDLHRGLLHVSSNEGGTRLTPAASTSWTAWMQNTSGCCWPLGLSWSLVTIFCGCFFNSKTVRLLYMSQPDGYDYLFQPLELHDRAKYRVWFHPTTIYPRREKNDWI